MVKTVEVHPMFKQRQGIFYPPGQTGPQLEDLAEAWFREHPVRTNRKLLPIRWTAYQVEAKFGKETGRMNRLARAAGNLSLIDTYFTFVQYDDGILVPMKADCKVFACCKGDVAVPLLFDEHPVNPQKKTILASFLGQFGTHPIRALMSKTLLGNRDLIICDTGSVLLFETITQASYFILCPRGYSRTSFRMFEALQMGSVPVYISDEFWMPFEKDIKWESFCVIVKPDEIAGIPDRLKKIIDSGEYESMVSAGRETYQRYFTPEGCFNQVKKILEDETDGRL